MDIALDTVSMNHICRPGVPDRIDDITLRIRGRLLRIVVDSGQSLVDEWKKTAKREVVNEFISHWAEHGGFVVLRKTTPLGKELRDGLRKLGFADAGDKLVVAIAANTTDRVVVSSDHDFWDPLDSNKFGVAAAPVSSLLLSRAGIQVLTIEMLVGKVPLVAISRGSPRSKRS